MRSKQAPRWEDPVWDVSAFTKRPNASENAQNLKFRALKKTSGGRNKNLPYAHSFGDVLKAYVVHRLDESYGTPRRYSHTLILSSVNKIRGLIDDLVDNHRLKHLTDAQAWQIEGHLANIRSSSDYHKVKRFLETLREKLILPQIIGLEMKAPSQSKIGKAAASARAPTTWDEIAALGTAFHRVAFAPDHALVDPGTRFWTSCATILATTPSRETELWRLPANLEVVNDPAAAFGADYKPLIHEDLSFKYGLRWWPAKGGRPIVKFVPTPMVAVSQRALEIIREYTEEPRGVAKWIIDNPGKLPIPKDHSDFVECRTSGVITDEQIKILLGVKNARLSEVKRWTKEYRATAATLQRSGNQRTKRMYVYDFETFEKDWWNDFQRRFPTWPLVVDDDGLKLRADEALMVSFEGALTSTVVNKSKIYLEIPTQNNLRNFLAAKADDKNTTVFERLDIRLPDGTHPRIQSHDLRHFLNTMAQRAGVPQKIIASWSGRKDLGQNMVYDHRTDEERVQDIGKGVDYDEVTSDELITLQMEAFRGEIAPPSKFVLSAQQSNFNEIRKKLFINVTQGGFCIGDLREELCPSAQNCINCSRHMVCAGAENSTAIFREKARIMNLQHRELKEQLKAGRRGVTKEHVEHMAAQCRGANEMLLALNDPEAVEGTPILRINYTAPQRTRFSDRVIEHHAERLALIEAKKEIAHG